MQGVTIGFYQPTSTRLQTFRRNRFFQLLDEQFLCVSPNLRSPPLRKLQE